MSDNPLKSAGLSRERSPTDPHECCAWANARMSQDLANMGGEWVVTGNRSQPIALRFNR